MQGKKEMLERLVRLAEGSINFYNVSLEKARDMSKRKGFILLFSPKDEGFITGYEDYESPENMFIWLFGILPEFQGKGLGSKLLDDFEKIAKDRGYRRVRSYTYNRFKSKIILSLNRGYRIIETKFEKDRNDYRIMLEKDLLGGI